MSRLRSLVPSTHSLFVFEAAARNLSFKQAAGELNVTQPSISHAVKMLERHCRVELFLRDNRGVRLTEAGQALYEGVRSAFSRIERSLEEISDQGTKYLTFAASSSLAAHWLAPQLYPFQNEHPAIGIKVVSTDGDIEPDSEIDVTVWVRPRDFARADSWFICDEVVFPVCSPGYLASHPEIRDVARLGRHRLLHSSDPFRKRMGWAEWMDLAGTDSSDLAPIKPGIVFNDYQLALQAALAGEGVALGWGLTTQYLLENKLLVRPTDREIRTDRAFFLLASSRMGGNERCRVLVDWFMARSSALRP